MKFSERYPKIAAIMTTLGITSILENATGAQLSNEDWEKLENKVQTDIDAVKAQNSDLEAKLTGAQNDLTAANKTVTDYNAALAKACEAAQVSGKSGVEAIGAITEALTKWGALPGAMSTNVNTTADRTEASAIDSLPYNKEADMMGFGKKN